MLMDEACYIIIPTSSKYLDICKNFIAVLSNSWPDCPYNWYYRLREMMKGSKGQNACLMVRMRHW